MALKDMGLVPLIIDIDDDIIKPLFAKEGDYRSRGIELQILNKGKEIDTTGIIVEFFAKPRDGKVYVVEATPVDATKGKYEIVYPSSILQPGVVQCEIRLVKMTDGEIDEIITTKSFNLKVYETIADEDIFEGIDIEPIIEILVQAARNEEERIQAENERIQAENERIQAENERIQAENVRQSNENIRNLNEQTRQQNEQTRQQNEQQRIDLYNALKDLDVSQYELRLQKLEHDTSVEEFILEEWDEPVISLPSNATNGQINDIKIEGKTYRNILEDYFGKSDSWEILNGEILDDDFIKGTANGNFRSFLLKSGVITLKPSTQYTIFVEVRKNTLNDRGLYVTSTNQNDSFGVNNIISPGETGIFKFLVTTKSDLTNTFPLRMFIRPETTSGEIEFRVMLLEGDYTNENISYIRGTKSTFGAIRIKSVGKNIWESKKAADDIVQIVNNSNAAYLTNIDGRNCLALVGGSAIRHKEVFNKFQPNTQYTIQVYAKKGDSSNNGGYLLIRYTDGSVGKVFPPSDEWSKVVYTSDSGKTIESIQLTYGDTGYTNYFDYDTLQIEEGTQATEYEPYKESTLYVTAKDEEGNILELRSLPNGTKDEIRVSEKKVIIRTKEIILNGSESWGQVTSASFEKTLRFRLYIDDLQPTASSVVINHINNVLPSITHNSIVSNDVEGLGVHNISREINIRIDKSRLATESVTGFKAWLQTNPITLIYQLAEPIEIPVEVFGNLQSYENGTVYVETIIPRVDFYTPEGIELEGPPEKEPRIKEIDSLYLVNRENGLLIPLDISKAIIEDIALRHPDLFTGALVDWDYIPDVESTNPTISMKLPTNIKTSVNSLLDAENRNRKDIEWNKIKLGLLDDEFNEHIENKDNPHNITPDQIGALKQEDFNIHVSENSGKHITESGENENGRYIKFDDGTMIVYMPDISIIGNDSSYAQISVPFPHLFDEIPVAFSVPKNRVRVSTGERSTIKYFTAIPVNVSGSQISALRFMYGDSSNLGSDYEFIVDVIAIGRWK